jgi:hypothetical protein
MSQCKNKRVYRTESQAQRVLRIAWKIAISQGKTRDLPCRAYICKECKKWHLTSKPDWKLTGVPKQEAPPEGRAS